MLLPLVQIAAILAIALYLVRWRIGVKRRNSQTWESLIARLRPDWSARGTKRSFPLERGPERNPRRRLEDVWEVQRACGPSTRMRV